MKNNELYILGCGGHARSVADVALFNNPGLKIIFVDKNAKENEKIWGFNVIKGLPEEAKIIHLAICSNEMRENFCSEINPINIISKTAHIGKNAKIKDGCFVAHKAYIGPDVKIGKSTIINTASVIEHEVEIGDFCHIAPNSTICGRSKIKNNVFVGAGAIIKDKVNICSNTIIGAGSVVVKNINENGVYVGIPAIKKDYQ